MKRSRFSEEQIIGILKEHQAGLGAKELCRKHGISGPPETGSRGRATCRGGAQRGASVSASATTPIVRRRVQGQ